MKIDTLRDVSICIKRRRKEINMSQRTLMKRSDVGHATISRVENEETELVLGSLLRLLHALGLEMYIIKQGECDIEDKQK